MELLILLLLGGPLGAPLSLPPLPEDPAMLRAAPAECLWYLAQAGMAKPDPASKNHTEQLLAEAELQKFLTELEAKLMEGVGRQPGSPEQVQARHEAIRLAKIWFTRPTAVFVSTVNPQAQEVRGGAVINLGNDKDAALKSLAFFEKLAGLEPAAGRWKKLPIPIPAEYGLEGNYLVLGIGAGEAEAIAGRLAKPGNSPAWLAAIKKDLAIERPAISHYLNVKKMLDLSLAQAPPQAKTALEAAGLAQIKHVVSGSGLDTTGVVSRTMIALDGPPKGLLSALGGAPLAAADLSAIPADSTLAFAGRLDGDLLLKAFLDFVGQVAPNDQQNAEQGIQMAEAALGFKVREDLLKALGTTWSVYNSPNEGGFVFTGLTGVVSLRDPARFRKTHDQLLGMIKAKTEADREQGHTDFLIGEFAASGQKCYSIDSTNDDMPFAPAWCVTDKELVVSLFPQGVKAFLARRGAAATSSATLGASPVLARHLAASEGTVFVAYHDARETFKLIYPTVQMLATMGATSLRESGLNVNVAMLPSASSISKHLGPEVTAFKKTANGFVLETRGTNPLSSAMGTFSTFAAIGMLNGRMTGTAGSPLAIRTTGGAATMSSNQMRQFLLAMHTYEAVYGSLPSVSDKDGKPRGLSWRVHLLPYIEQNALYNKFKLDEPWDSPHNKELIKFMPAIYQAPGSKVAAEFKTVYLTPRGKDTIFAPTGKVTLEGIEDGTSNTLMIIEATDDRAVVWTKPDDLEIDLAKPHTGLLIRGGKILVGFGDGTTRMIPATVPAETLKGLFTRNGGEVTQLE